VNPAMAVVENNPPVVAKRRTDIHMGELSQAWKETAHELMLLRWSFIFQVGGLRAQWGEQTEETFQKLVRAIRQKVGFTSERFLDCDAAGEVFGHRDQVELDVVIKDGKASVVEIKSALDSGNTYLFDREVAF
jgi:hypothetical protein